jgi:hypothetical protein
MANRKAVINFVFRDTLIPTTVMARRILIEQKNAYVTPRSVSTIARDVKRSLTVPRRDQKSINKPVPILIPTAVMARGPRASQKQAPAVTPRSVSAPAASVELLLTLSSGTDRSDNKSRETSPMTNATSYSAKTSNTSISDVTGSDAPPSTKFPSTDDCDVREEFDGSNKRFTWQVDGDDNDGCNVSCFTKSPGSRFQFLDNLVTYPQPGDRSSRASDLDGSASVSALDYQGEHADYKHERGLYENLIGGWTS